MEYAAKVSAEAPEPDTANPDLATVIGKNAQRLRKNAGLTLDQVSIAARIRGLNWSESRVADFESGRAAPNLATLIAFCLALADAGCAKATFPELLRSTPPIQINGSLLLWDDDVVNLLSGRPVQEPKPLGQTRPDLPKSFTSIAPHEWLIAERYPVPDDQPTLLLHLALAKASGATEERTRKALGISSMLLAILSAALWKRTFSQERDRRAGEGANAQKRGQVSRQMRAELQAAIEAATHGDDK
jgi:transcriptional regulator with XRE-family HTH domain